MRIGELAGVAGVSTRAVRHYHRIGLLPEPPRHTNGYREYSLRDAVELCRIRRLTELGLSLEEVRDVLADDSGRDLAEILAELDADLARQEDVLRQRRARLGRLLAEVSDTGALPSHAPVSESLSALFASMAGVAAGEPGPEPAMVAKERELLALLDTGRGDHRDGIGAALRSLSADPAYLARVYPLYAQLDALADAPVDDPRVAEVARALVEVIPVGLTAGAALPGEAELAARDGFVGAFFAEFAPAQAAAVRAAIRLLRDGPGRTDGLAAGPDVPTGQNSTDGNGEVS